MSAVPEFMPNLLHDARRSDLYSSSAAELRRANALLASARIPVEVPRARQGNSHFVGPGKFYADWNEFDADLDKWEDERASRMRLMAKRHKAQQRFSADAPQESE